MEKEKKEEVKEKADSTVFPYQISLAELVRNKKLFEQYTKEFADEIHNMSDEEWRRFKEKCWCSPFGHNNRI